MCTSAPLKGNLCKDPRTKKFFSAKLLSVERNLVETSQLRNNYNAAA